MRVLAGSADRGPIYSSAALIGSLAALSLTVASGLPTFAVSLLAVGVIGFAVWHRTLLQWPALLSSLLLLIMFVPIRRYRIPGDLPFELEPYRLAVAFLIVAWASALLVDPRVRLRRSGLERPLAAVAVAMLASVVVNGAQPDPPATSADVVKTLTFFASFFLIFYFIVSVIRARSTVENLVKLLVACGAVLGALAVYESRTGYNPFNDLGNVVPFLEPVLIQSIEARGAAQRAYGPAQHPIALGAALVMLLPLAIYLARGTGARRWWGAAALIMLGTVATVSRTSILMLLTTALVFLWLRRSETKRLWPALIPAIVIIHFALPGHLGTLRASFFPTGGLIAEQESSAGSRSSAGRVADIGPALDEVSKQPFLGTGFGSRVESGPQANAAILDNQWLDTLLETGAVGFAAWLWLFVFIARRWGRSAKEDRSPNGWLTVAIVASVLSYAVGMLTFDSFAFIQVTLLLFIVLGIAAVVRRHDRGSRQGATAQS